MSITKSITLVLCLASIAIAHDHSLFDKCAVTGYPCEPSANIKDHGDSNTKILAFGYSQHIGTIHLLNHQFQDSFLVMKVNALINKV